MHGYSPDNTYLGFDYGKKRIGVATGQELTRTANKLTTIVCHGKQPDWNQLDALIEEWKPDALVVGMPVHMDGKPNEITPEVEKFCQELNQRYNLPVYNEDERLSSYEAESLMKEQNIDPIKHKKQLDQIAAQLILQSWLEKAHDMRFSHDNHDDKQETSQ
jgi:putative Holliday junction resolvase